MRWFITILIGSTPDVGLAQKTSSDNPAASAAQELLVTSLADYSATQQPIPGTLRFAVETGVRPCTVRFNVGGQIILKRKLYIVAPFIAIDGSTAPGDGITICRWPVEIVNTHDVVLRHLRIRCGDCWNSEQVLLQQHGVGGQRSLLVFGDRPTPVQNVLVEKFSIQNSTDDKGNVWGNCRNIVVRYCIFSGSHIEMSKAFLAGDAPDKPNPDAPDWLTLDHCLFSEAWGRTPDVAGGVCHLVNSVMVAPMQGGRFSHAKANIIGNYLVSKTNHPWTVPDRVLVAEAHTIADNALFVSGNYLDGQLCANSNTIGQLNKGQTSLPARVFRTDPWPGAPPAELATKALTGVLGKAGCTLPKRDDHDSKLIERMSRLIGH